MRTKDRSNEKTHNDRPQKKTNFYPKDASNDVSFNQFENKGKILVS